MTFLDRGTLKSVAGNKRAWSTHIFRADQKNTAYWRDLREYDCAGERSRSLYSVDYTAKGEVVTSYTEPEAWAPAVPQSVGAAMLESACRAAIAPDGIWEGDPASSIEKVRQVVDYMTNKAKP